MNETKFKQCSCVNCGKKLPCLEDELEELERQGELVDDFVLMEVEEQ